MIISSRSQFAPSYWRKVQAYTLSPFCKGDTILRVNVAGNTALMLGVLMSKHLRIITTHPILSRD